MIWSKFWLRILLIGQLRGLNLGNPLLSLDLRGLRSKRLSFVVGLVVLPWVLIVRTIILPICLVFYYKKTRRWSLPLWGIQCGP